jgi:inositol monophosphatase family protein
LLTRELPAVFRWAGGVARELRRHDIAIGGKHSGVASTDALTLADLALQELIVGALRDMGPIVRRCRIEAEEVTGDLERFAPDSDWTLGIDPVDGTKPYRDRTGNGYAVMLHARTPETVRYSLVYFPEEGGPEGSWLEATDEAVRVGQDDWTRPAREVLDALPPITRERRPAGRRVLVTGFLSRDAECARLVSAAGLDGFLGSDKSGSLYPLMARGAVEGILVHTPNVYDFPVCAHLARGFGGDAVWVHDGRPIDFRSLWLDERARMLRLPGIIACAVDRDVVTALVSVAKNWSPDRYDGAPPSS